MKTIMNKLLVVTALMLFHCHVAMANQGLYNIALNKPTTASSNDGYAGPASSAVDGNSQSRWASEWQDNQWIEVDLGKVEAIKKIILRWETAFGQSYKILTSTDKNNWQEVYATASGDGGIDDLPLEFSGRYIRMQGLNRGTQWGFSLWEFEVYAEGEAPTPPSTPTIPPAPPSSPAPDMTLVASQATLEGNAIMDGDVAYIQGAPSALEWRFNLPSTGEYQVTLHYYTGNNGYKENHFGVNGQLQKTGFEANANGTVTRKYVLNAGSHRVRVAAKSGDWGYIWVEKVEIRLLNSLSITSPADNSSLPSGANIVINYDKTGPARLFYSINRDGKMLYTGNSPLVIPYRGDGRYRIKFTLEGSILSETLAITVGTPIEPPFIKTSGTRLIKDNKPWLFNGTNQYYLMFKPAPMAEDFFARADKLGLKAVRTWAFCHDEKTHDSVCVNQYSGGTASTAEEAAEFFLALKSNRTPEEEAQLERSWALIDHYIALAKEYGIYLILALGDNWPNHNLGSLDVFAQAVGGSGIRGAFSNLEARKLYKRWISVLLNRVNPLTGVALKDEPIIMMWELLNEPRCRGNSSCETNSEDFTHFNGWVKEISDHIRSIDKKHLISIGTELSNLDSDDYIKKIHAHANIDIISAHIYPKPWGLKDIDTAIEFMQGRIDLAKTINKPLVYGEFSWMFERNTLAEDFEKRTEFFNEVYKLAEANKDVLGGMVSWQLSGLEWGNGNTPKGGCQWCSGPYGEYADGWYGNHDGYQFYCALDDSEYDIRTIGARGTNVEGDGISLESHKPTCDAVLNFSNTIKQINENASPVQ